jgi:hypothetical protein
VTVGSDCVEVASKRDLVFWKKLLDGMEGEVTDALPFGGVCTDVAARLRVGDGRESCE